MLFLILCSEISERSFVDSNQEGFDINETLEGIVSQGNTYVERNIEQRTVQRLVLVSSHYATGVDPL